MKQDKTLSLGRSCCLPLVLRDLQHLLRYMDDQLLRSNWQQNTLSYAFLQISTCSRSKGLLFIRAEYSGKGPERALRRSIPHRALPWRWPRFYDFSQVQKKMAWVRLLKNKWMSYLQCEGERGFRQWVLMWEDRLDNSTLHSIRLTWNTGSTRDCGANIQTLSISASQCFRGKHHLVRSASQKRHLNCKAAPWSTCVRAKLIFWAQRVWDLDVELKHQVLFPPPVLSKQCSL